METEPIGGSSIRKPQTEHPTSLVVERDQPIVAIPLIKDGREVVRYAVEENAMKTAHPSSPLSESIREALSLADAWSDRNWNEAIDALDRIRHESRSTPPIGPEGL
jgi:hypothetical protein